MPELPEVETIVRDLRRKVKGKKILNSWSDVLRYFNGEFSIFQKNIKGRQVKDIVRKGKNILFLLDGGWVLLVHQKMTGHFLVGRWKKSGKAWVSLNRGALEEKVNQYIHLMFRLDDGGMLALSDLRKFAKIVLAKKDELEKSFHLLSVAPDIFELNKEEFVSRLKVKKGKIKQVLTDQSVVSGIGNIYADEILWKAKLHPLSRVEKLSRAELSEIYSAGKKILREAIRKRGTSIDDYRDASGRPGRYGDIRKVYRREGEKCFRCGALIRRLKLGGRSAHYCPKCQKL